MRRQERKAAEGAEKKENGDKEKLSVEAVEKDGAQKLTAGVDAVKQVTEGIEQAVLQTS